MSELKSKRKKVNHSFATYKVDNNLYQVDVNLVAEILLNSGDIPLKINDINAAEISTLAQHYVKLKAKADKLAECLEKCSRAMGYAYEDHADYYYLNVQNDINKIIAEYRGEK